MTNTAILAASALLLFAYAVEHFGRHFRLPPVVLLIVTGLVARQILDSLGLHFHWVDPIVPIIGTLGLILIVLEGSLDLKVSRERQGLIVTALASSLLGFLVALAGFAFLFSYVIGFAIPTAMLAAIPFAVISSAVAIPSAAGLPERPREFVVYESSLSDILGVLVFYAWLAGQGSLEGFALDLFGGGVISSSSPWRPRCALVFHQPDRRQCPLPAAAGRHRVPVRDRQGAASVAADHRARLRPAHQQPASPHVAREAARAAYRRLYANAPRIQGAGGRAHVCQQELLFPAPGLLDQRAADDVGRGVADCRRRHRDRSLRRASSS